MSVLTWLRGRKTYIAAIIAALAAANGVCHFVSLETQDSVLALAAALGLYGLRSAVQDVGDKVGGSGPEGGA